MARDLMGFSVCTKCLLRSEVTPISRPRLIFSYLKIGQMVEISEPQVTQKPVKELCSIPLFFTQY